MPCLWVQSCASLVLSRDAFTKTWTCGNSRAISTALLVVSAGTRPLRELQASLTRSPSLDVNQRQC